MKGTFLVFEGIDGSGKRTLCNYVRELLEVKSIKVRTYQYPDYQSPWGKIITDFLSGAQELEVAVQFLTYAADILKDQKDIEKDLEKGYVVLSDRYITSTVAFQCSRGFDRKKAVEFVTMFEFIPPDIVFYMNVSPEIGMSRKKRQKGRLDRHEADIIFLKKVNRIYKELCDASFLARKWVEISADEELSQVKARVREEVEDIRNL